MGQIVTLLRGKSNINIHARMPGATQDCHKEAAVRMKPFSWVVTEVLVNFYTIYRILCNGACLLCVDLFLGGRMQVCIRLSIYGWCLWPHNILVGDGSSHLSILFWNVQTEIPNDLLASIEPASQTWGDAEAPKLQAFSAGWPRQSRTLLSESTTRIDAFASLISVPIKAMLN